MPVNSEELIAERRAERRAETRAARLTLKVPGAYGSHCPPPSRSSDQRLV